MSGGANENEINGSISSQAPSLPPNFSQLLDKVLANPEIIGAVATALSGSGGGAEKAREDARDNDAVTNSNSKAENENENKNENDNAAEHIDQTNGKENETRAFADVSEIMKKLPVLAKLLSAQGNKSTSASGGYDRRAGLMNAIKPYVSSHRREAIDRMIVFSRIADVLKNFK